ncbi:ribosome maturation factor RimM [Vannielia litorea]|uniref:ribosome maturation factor RimM n=1 Tax=Vannielia litorea TaxID=1217970 RepID=UPI001C954A64|nr:ribosome maturation factor RimM [Vannielia litorea]MBY6046084.1 ribosome maturation factor RimM [Vannielia litorea]MBY6073497.1 ribosome maturation factor RimM [Vannielia litorea]
MSAAKEAGMVCVGAIGGAFGVQGEVRLKSFCAEPTDIAEYGPLSTEDGKRQFTVSLTRPLKGALGARLTGIASKEEADALKGTRLYVARTRLPALPDDEFYYSDLIGLTVTDTGGEVLGKVLAVHDHGAGDLLEIRSAGGSDSFLLPFTREAVPTVDLTAGRLVVDPPEES